MPAKRSAKTTKPPTLNKDGSVRKKPGPKPGSKRKRKRKSKTALAIPRTRKEVIADNMKRNKRMFPYGNVVPKHKTKDVLRTPENLFEAVCDYFEWCENNPWMKTVGVDKEGNAIEQPKRIPFLIEGLCNHIGVSKSHWYAIQDEKNKEYFRDDLFPIVEWTNNVLYTQKLTGAAVDEFKENIIARILGLGDRRELTGKSIPNSNGKTEAIQVEIDREIRTTADIVVKKLLED